MKNRTLFLLVCGAFAFCAASAAGAEAELEADAKQLIKELAAQQEKSYASGDEAGFIESLRERFRGSDTSVEEKALALMGRVVASTPKRGTPLKLLFDNMLFAQNTVDRPRPGEIQARRVDEGERAPAPAARQPHSQKAKVELSPSSSFRAFAAAPPTPFSQGIKYFNKQELSSLKDAVADPRDIIDAKLYRVSSALNRGAVDNLNVEHEHLVYAARYQYRGPDGRTQTGEFARPFGYVGNVKMTLAEWGNGTTSDLKEEVQRFGGWKQALNAYNTLAVNQERLTSAVESGDMEYRPIGKANAHSVGAWAYTGLPLAARALTDFGKAIWSPLSIGTPVTPMNCRDMAQYLSDKVRAME